MNRLVYILVILITLSCVDHIGPGQTDGLVEVMLDLEVKPDLSLDCNEYQGFETKAVIDPEMNDSTPLKSIISNFWVIQFDGVNDDSRLVGQPYYVSDMDDFMTPVSEGGKGGMVTLAASRENNLIVILANTFEPGMKFPQKMFLSELKTNNFRSVSDPEDHLSAAGSDRMLVFCGSSRAVIGQGVSVSCKLERNVAKAVIRLTNQSDDVDIVSYQLRSIPSVSHYFTSYPLPEIFPAGKSSRIDYPVEDAFLSAKGSTTTSVFYLPVNKWNSEDRVTNEESKNRYAPEGATYLQVNAVGKSDGAPLTYRFYLGANMTTDYSLMPNVSYSYDFVISSRGDAEFDTRVEEDLLVNFANTNDEVANCYVIHPLQKNDKLRRFRIPVKRVDEFWGGKAGYEDVPEYTLGADGEWNVSVLVSDFDRSGLNFTVSSGVGSYDAVTCDLKYFEFEVNADIRGNAIIGLRKGSGPILWSWHLWITDYAPEEAYNHTPQTGVYAYEVSGNGVVHRYEQAIWQDKYAGRFIMDRNLGALDTGFPGKGNGALYYQFGRKDPFFANQATGFSEFGMISYENIPSESGVDTYTVRYAVHNPLMYINTQRKAWTKDNKYNPSNHDGSILWQDPHTSRDQYPSRFSEKSIFDPCPPGYRVPEPAVWEDFRANSSPLPTTNLTSSDILARGFQSFIEVNGLCYWPYPASGVNDKVPSKVVYYPALGYMERLIVGDMNGRLFYGHTSTPLNTDDCKGLKYGFEADGPYLSSSYPLSRNLGMPVRCVTSHDPKL
jgi:hypothetical protein